MFSGSIIEEVLGSWKWDVLDKDKKRIKDHLTALQILKERGVKGSGIIGAYHTRRVAPLMSYVLPLYLMVPGHCLKGWRLSMKRSPHRSGAVDQGGDGAFEGQCQCCP